MIPGDGSASRRNEGVQLAYAPCPLGCQSGETLILSAQDNVQGLPGVFSVVRCNGCGLLRTNPRPSIDTIGFYYPDSYGPYTVQKSTASVVRQTALARFLRRLVHAVVDFKTEALPPIAVGQMLEVGCASGSFLEKCAKVGWAVHGIEFSPSAAAAARSRGFEVFSGPLEGAPAPASQFDLIVGWMVIEHLHDPVRALRQLRDWAKPGAWLAISVPDAGSVGFRCFKSHWYDLHLPNHLTHFSRTNIGEVLRAAGWRVEKIQHHRVLHSLIASFGQALQSWGLIWLGSKLRQFPTNGGRLSYFLYPIATALAIAGQTGRMTVWSKRV